jgi:hypothetical protein
VGCPSLRLARKQVDKRLRVAFTNLVLLAKEHLFPSQVYYHYNLVYLTDLQGEPMPEVWRDFLARLHYGR